MQQTTIVRAFGNNFLGHAPVWYKWAILAFLAINPLVFFLVSPYMAGWLLVLEFIFTLAMALKCYPLQPGGLLALQAVVMGMTTPQMVYDEVVTNIQVILLLVFMVAGIYFMRDLLLFIFTRVLLRVRSRALLSLLFCAVAAFLSAFLDALTVTAVLMTVAVGFYSVYHKTAHAAGADALDDSLFSLDFINRFLRNDSHEHDASGPLPGPHREDIRQFRAFLRGLMMHGVVGTALGGVCTLVGEPQNLLIAERAGWNFQEFFWTMSPVTIPALIAGLACCLALEYSGRFGYGVELPEPVRLVLEHYAKAQDEQRDSRALARLWAQALGGVVLVLALAMHVAAVGLVGLMIIVLLTATTGISEEQDMAPAFEEALPFTTLLVVFFAVVAVIHQQHLFSGVIQWVLAMPEDIQPLLFFFANGVLSMISDNVFVATVYINEVYQARVENVISREQFDMLAVAINAGTNLTSVATPNGQAAFLFLLTSALAQLIRLSYLRMLWMALPYTIVLTIVAAIAIRFNF